VLDVGTGTGVAGYVAAEMLHFEGFVLGVDASLEMLQLAKKRAKLRIAAAQVPGLPFHEGTFDMVMASFVLSHFPCYETALLDMVRVLKSAGRLGATAWGNNEDELRPTWQELSEQFVSKETLSEALRRAIPWEERFSDAGHLKQALRQAGLQSILVEKKEYSVRMSIGDYLVGREISMQGRYIRQAIDETRWQEFRKWVRFSQADIKTLLSTPVPRYWLLARSRDARQQRCRSSRSNRTAAQA
jgi:SAM-dependent methyltransferase